MTSEKLLDHYDAVVIGGGAAGLNGALMLARSRRSVVVIDAGQPRNAPAAAIHGLLGHDGTPPAELLARGREEVRSYGGTIVAGEVTSAFRSDHGFTIGLADGRSVDARRLLVTTGLVDELPEIDGLAERWGHDVIHCPYCHGYEVRDQAIGVLATGPMAVHQALLFHQLSDDVVLLAHDSPPTEEQHAQLAARGIPVVTGRVIGLEVRDDRLSGVRLEEGRVVARQVVVVGPRMVARAGFLDELGLKPVEHSSGMGEHLPADAFGRTDVPGVWVAGNVTDLAAQVGASAAAGATAGAHINADLITEETDAALAEHRFDQDYWDEHYRDSAHEGSRPPNPHLLRETSTLTVGTALDAGCGEGVEATWLAEQGWQVTAVDIAGEPLERAEAQTHAGDRVRWVKADLSGWEPEQQFDLVTTHYAHPELPQLEFYDRIAGWVAPEGTLLIVGHLHHDGPSHGHSHPPERATVTARDVAARLDPAEWEIVTADETTRHAGGSQLHDVVVRARRLV